MTVMTSVYAVQGIVNLALLTLTPAWLYEEVGTAFLPCSRGKFLLHSKQAGRKKSELNSVTAELVQGMDACTDGSVQSVDLIGPMTSQ